MKRLILAALLPLTMIACTHTNNDYHSTAPSTTYTTLSSYQWYLNDARTRHGQLIDGMFARTDNPVRLDFEGNRFYINNTCNKMTGTYTLTGTRMTFSRMAGTMMNCAFDDLNRLDREVSNRLTGTVSYALVTQTKPLLSMTLANGDVLSFTGIPTSQSEYDSVGDAMFLEVAEYTHPCAARPGTYDNQCLLVRRVLIDENGMKTIPSPRWQYLDQPIQGYTHRPGIRNIIKVKRYNIVNPRIGQPSTAYNLDMIVESQVIRP